MNRLGDVKIEFLRLLIPLKQKRFPIYYHATGTPMLGRSETASDAMCPEVEGSCQRLVFIWIQEKVDVGTTMIATLLHLCLESEMIMR